MIIEYSNVIVCGQKGSQLILVSMVSGA